MMKLIKRSSLGMTLMEISAMLVVVSIIALGMTSGAQAVILHYQTDTVRQDLRQYGNMIMREITQELKFAQKIEIDGQYGFSRLKLYEYFTDMTPNLYISCNPNTGIEFNSAIPLNGAMKFPNKGVFRGEGQREIYIKDFNVSYGNDTRAILALFKQTFVNITLTIGMESDVMDEANPVKEEHSFRRSIFLGTPYIQKKLTNSSVEDTDDV